MNHKITNQSADRVYTLSEVQVLTDADGNDLYEYAESIQFFVDSEDSNIYIVLTIDENGNVTEAEKVEDMTITMVDALITTESTTTEAVKDQTETTTYDDSSITDVQSTTTTQTTTTTAASTTTTAVSSGSPQTGDSRNVIGIFAAAGMALFLMTALATTRKHEDE